MSEFFNKARLNLLRWKLAFWKIGVGVLIVIIGGVIAALPGQDWMTPMLLKKFLFYIGIFLSALKAVDIGIDQTISLIKSGIQNGSGQETTFTQKPPTI